MTTIGLITIGQAPRSDVTPELLDHFESKPEILEVGALDSFSDVASVERELAPTSEEPRYVTRMRDGSEVLVRKNAAHELVRERVREIEDEVSVIAILCTGSFPDIDALVPVLRPSKLLHSWVTAIGARRVGVMMPKGEQADQTASKWSNEFKVTAAAGNPYAEDDEITDAATEIGTDTDLIVMDCMGYNESMRTIVRETTGTGVLLGRSVLAKTISEVQ